LVRHSHWSTASDANSKAVMMKDVSLFMCVFIC